jgi:hypothetical protein
VGQEKAGGKGGVGIEVVWWFGGSGEGRLGKVDGCFRVGLFLNWKSRLGPREWGAGESPIWPFGLDSFTRTGEMIKAYLKTFNEVMAEGKASLGAA